MKLRIATSLASILLSTALMPIPAFAVKVMDLRAEQLMMGADSIKKELDLTPNQQTLWQQMTAKAWGILRTRQSRREKLQADLKTRLTAGTSDLRDMTGSIDNEATVSAGEDKQLRELWLTVNDALNDKQRAQVIDLLTSQLDRLDVDPAGHGAPPGGHEKSAGSGGGRHRGGGGMGGGGMPGANGGF